MSFGPTSSPSPTSGDLVKLLDEEMDGVAHEQRERLETIDGELDDVKKQLGRVWNFIARSDSVDVAQASTSSWDSGSARRNWRSPRRRPEGCSRSGDSS